MQYFSKTYVTTAKHLLNMNYVSGIVFYMDYLIYFSKQSFNLDTIIISILQSRKQR